MRCAAAAVVYSQRENRLMEEYGCRREWKRKSKNTAPDGIRQKGR